MTVKITTVKYGQTQSFPGYNNERMEVTAELADGEDCLAAVKQLKGLVQFQLDQFRAVRVAEQQMLIDAEEQRRQEWLRERAARLEVQSDDNEVEEDEEEEPTPF